MIEVDGNWVVEEDEVIYGERGEFVDKRLKPNPLDFSSVS